MYSQCLILLLFGVLCCLVFSTDSLAIKARRKRDKMDIFNGVVVTLLEKCNLGLKNIMLYDNTSDSSTFKALSVLRPPIALVLKGESKLEEGYKRPDIMVENQAFIGVISRQLEWYRFRDNMHYTWPCRHNCMAIIIEKPGYQCSNASPIILTMAITYITTYYVCAVGDNFPRIFTYDIFGNTRPAYWDIVAREKIITSSATVYGRPYKKAEICKGFLFNRTNLLDNPYVMVGFMQSIDYPGRVGFFYNDAIEDVSDENDVENLKNLQRILNMSFKYYLNIRQHGHHNTESTRLMYYEGSLSIIMHGYLLNQTTESNPSYPIIYTQFVILSHNQGLATPLEKIAKFYGIWTITSLTIILAVTFLVIWLKTNRNISFAAFDILRLLINSGVSVPINTLSLKIFFCMIFLYFTVIHATFSGNLPKFLTIPQFRDNIETIEDLADSRIKTIYNLYMRYDEDMQNYEVIKRKTIITDQMDVCLSKVINNTDSVCIGLEESFQRYVAKHGSNNKFHISKNRLRPIALSLHYHKRFPFRERFDWALMALTETSIYDHLDTYYREQDTLHVLKESIKAHIDFRPIRLDDLKFAFIFLMIGNSLGILCFIAEILISRRRNIGMKIKNVRKVLNYRRKVKVRRITVQPK